MKKIILAAFLGATLGVFTAVKLTGPVLAENNSAKADVYEQLDLFGDIFDRIRSEYVEEVDPKDLIEAAKRWECKIFYEPLTLFLAEKRICILHHPELISNELLKENDLILHGHTHRYRKEVIGDTLIFNPGECAGFMKNKNQVGVVDLKTLTTEIFTF